MELTTEHLDLASAAYLLSLEGKGMVLEPEAYMAAHELCDAGWLERYWRGDELCWRWTQAGEAALDLNALVESVQGREN